MGLATSAEGCAAGPSSLFSIAEWRQWRRGARYNAAVGASCRYHVNRPLATKYELTTQILGDGANGNVMLAQGRAGTAVERRGFAVKRIAKCGITDRGRRVDPAKVKSEVMLMLSLDHPNIARLEDVFDMPSEIYMVMELLGEDLLTRISERGRYDEGVAAGAVRQMCQAVAYLHGQDPPVVHRDLKPENFVYERQGSDLLKLIDFGLSTKWDKRVSKKMEGYVGTQMYMAPEVILSQSCTEKCDLFSLGIIAYILVAGHPPFDDARDMYKYRPFDRREYTDVSPDGRNFIQSLLCREASGRPSAEQCLGLPWLQRPEGASAQGAVFGEAVLKSMRSFSNATRFKRACLSMVALTLTAEDREHLRSCFVEMDRNGDGKISLKEMRMALEKSFAVNTAEANELFAKLDDGDGEICYPDFLACAMQESVRMHRDVLEAVFSRFDRDNRHFITISDLRSILGEDFQEADARELLEELDNTPSHQISCQEFVNFLTPCEEDEEQKEEEEEAREEEEPREEAQEASPAPVRRRSFLARLQKASRVIDSELSRAQQPQEGRRPATLPAISTRQWNTPDPLQRLGKDFREVKSL